MKNSLIGTDIGIKMDDPYPENIKATMNRHGRENTV